MARCSACQAEFLVPSLEQLRGNARTWGGAPIAAPQLVRVSGDVIAVTIDNVLPPRCMKCYSKDTHPAAMTLLHHHSAIYALVPIVALVVSALINDFALLPAALLTYAFFVRPSRVIVPLCDRHRSTYRDLLVSAFIALALSVLGYFLNLFLSFQPGSVRRNEWLVPLLTLTTFLLALLFMAINIIRGRVMLRSVDLPDERIWVAGVSRAYVAELNRAPVPTR